MFIVTIVGITEGNVRDLYLKMVVCLGLSDRLGLVLKLRQTDLTVTVAVRPQMVKGPGTNCRQSRARE